MQIPGQTRLGQGFPGGAGALSPGITGRVPGVPTFSSVPRVQAPPPGMGLGTGMGLPTYRPVTTGTSGPPPSALQQFGTDVAPSRKAYRLAEAMTILDRIRKGYLSEKNAKRMIERFPAEVKRQLTETIADDPMLVTNLGLREYRSKDKKRGFLGELVKDVRRVERNLARDVQTTVVGAIPGTVQAAKAVGADIADLASIARPTARTGRTGGQEFEPLKETRRQVLDPMIESYKHMYGPAMPGTPGGIGETLHRMGEHPLQPILDAATVASLGIGGTARAASAARAVGNLPGAKKPMRRVTPKEIEEHPYAVRAPIMKMPNGEIRVGMPGQGHDELWTPEESQMLERLYQEDPDLADKVTFEQTAQGTVIFDPDTGKVAKVNIGEEHPPSIHQEWPPERGISVTHDRVPEAELDELQGPMMAAARDFFEGRPGPTGREKAGAALRGFARPEHRGSLIEAYERAGGLQLRGRIAAARAAARGEQVEPPTPEAPGEGVAPTPPEPGAPPTPEAPEPMAPVAPSEDPVVDSLRAAYQQTGDSEVAIQQHTEATGAPPTAQQIQMAFPNRPQPDIEVTPEDLATLQQRSIDPEVEEAREAAMMMATVRAGAPLTNVDFTRATERVDQELQELGEFMDPQHVADAREVMLENLERAAREPANELASQLGPEFNISPQLFRGEALDKLSLGEWAPNFSVKVGEGIDAPSFTVAARPDGGWEVYDTIEITDKDFFTNQADVDKYMDAIQKVQGRDPDEVLTLYRAMSKGEKDIWDRGETIPIGKWFTSEETDQYAKDIMGQFPGLYQFKVRAGDVVEMSPGQFQLKSPAKLDGNEITGSKGKPSEATLRPDLETLEQAAEALPAAGRAIPDEEYRRPTVEELQETARWKNYFSVFVNKDTGETIISPPGWDHYEMYDEMGGLEKKLGGRPEEPKRANLDNPWITGTGIFDPDTAEVARVNLWRRTKEGDDRDFAMETTSPELKALSEKVRVEAEKTFGRAEPEAPAGAAPPPVEPPPTTAAPGEPAPEVPTPTPTKLDLKAGIGAFFERREAITHEAELKEIMDEFVSVMDDPNLRLNRRSPREVAKDVVADLRATRHAGRQRPAEMASKLPGFISAGSTGKVLSAAETTLREASDLVRAGAIYLRPAYLPNNWASNLFMNTIQQGIFAPINLGKSLVLDKHIGQKYARVIDSAMGQTAAGSVMAPKGRGYIGSGVRPVADILSAVADQPFRRSALLHELRRDGYRTLNQVKGLLDDVAKGDEKAIRTLAVNSRKAQEEIVKFGKMNDMERGVLRNIVFVYTWMRGAGRYAGRFPLQHPIQAAVAVHLGQEGKEWMDRELGGVPSFLMGAVPVGRNDNGDPILINPFSLNPLGTGIDIARAAVGTAEVLRNPNEFNKFAEEDLLGLANPLIQAYMEAREGGNPPHEEAMRAIAPIRLQHELRHPGSGGVYPTSRKEALGKYMFGTLFPRQADQAAITRAVERENVGNRANLVPHQTKLYKKLTGTDMPDELVTAYRRDLEMVEDIKSFQKGYAKDHGSQGFRNMPPINRVKAAIEWHRENGTIEDQQLNRIEVSLQGIKQDVVLNDIANGLWAATGAGSITRTWDQMLKQAKGQQMTRERP